MAARKKAPTKKTSRRAHAIANGYRSGLEEEVGAALDALGVRYEFEKIVFTYERPPSRYTPDFVLENGVIIETKGRFTGADRSKHLLVRKSNPNVDIRFVFQNPNAKLYKGSKTTYAAWAEKHGFLWAKKRVPAEWTR
jgi:hypothetical protein